MTTETPDFFLFWDLTDDEPTMVEKLEEKLELEGLRRYYDIHDERMRRS